MFLIALAVICIIFGEGLFDPTFNGNLSQSVDESRQGKIQGINLSLQAIINVFIPIVAGAIYYYSPPSLYAISVIVVTTAILLYKKY